MKKQFKIRGGLFQNGTSLGNQLIANSIQMNTRTVQILEIFFYFFYFFNFLFGGQISLGGCCYLILYINIYTYIIHIYKYIYARRIFDKKEKRKKEKNFLDDVNAKDCQKSNS